MRIAAALLIAAGLVATLAPGASAARRSRGSADGGPILLGTDPPGSLRRTIASDGGVTSRAVQDAGPSASDRELQQLRARVTALEQQREQLQAQSQQLQQVVQQLQELRNQLAQAESQRRNNEQQQAQHRDAIQSGIRALQQAEAALMGGDSAVDDQLAQAHGVFPPQAQRDLDAARTALRNRDLSVARSYIAAAISDAQQGR